MSEVLDPPVAHPVCAAVAGLGRELDGLLGANLWSLSDAQVLAHRQALEQLAARLDAAKLAATREIEGRDAARAAGAPCTQVWLQSVVRLRPAAAKEEVALAAALAGELTATGAALAAGHLSAAHAAETRRALAALPAAVPTHTRRDGEAFLLARSRAFRPDQVPVLGRHLLHVLDPDLGARLARDEQTHTDAAHLTLTHRGDGTRDLRGRLDAEAGALLAAALDPLAAPRPDADGTPDPRPAARRRAEALLELVRLALASPEMPDQGGEPVTLLVTVPLHTLEARLARPRADDGTDRPGGVPAATLEDGTPLSAEAARRLACDARLVAAVLGPASAVLDIGRAARAIPRPLRRALTARDRGCAFPACDRPPAWCQAHHIVHWAHGGPTALTNLVLLCAAHHRAVHHHGWHVHIAPNGIPTFTPPRWIDPTQTPITRNWRHHLDQLPLLN